MNQKVGFGLKIIDDNNLTRLFPEAPGMTLKYTRCQLWSPVSIESKTGLQIFG
jgi:hypothetical protein